MSARHAETYAKQAASTNKPVEEKLTLIAKALEELAKAVGKIEQDVRMLPR